MKTILRNIGSLILALTLAVIFYVLPLKGEMCSTMISAVDGENLSALQKRVYSSFRSTCRRESLIQGKLFCLYCIRLQLNGRGQIFTGRNTILLVGR